MVTEGPDSPDHQFGGKWTDQKLRALEKYLGAYQTIFKVNLAAKHFQTVYLDAFAGTGKRVSELNAQQQTLDLEKDAVAFRKGSVRVALEIPKQFDHYLFVEKKRKYARELERVLASEYPQLAYNCTVRRAEANEFLANWCRSQDWRRTRAVVFLDPYGMSVEWSTIEKLAETKGIDLWVLLPVGVAINRVLVRGELPTPVWGKRLSKLFGTNDWVKSFYRKTQQADLFGPSESIEKTADFKGISDFFVARLRTVFPFVADQPRMLLNSRKNPLFVLYFATHNKTGLRIASHILTH